MRSEGPRQPLQPRRRLRRFELQHVQRQLIGPRHIPNDDFIGKLGLPVVLSFGPGNRRRLLQQLIDNRAHSQRRLVDDHVLKLDAVGLEEVE